MKIFPALRDLNTRAATFFTACFASVAATFLPAQAMATGFDDTDILAAIAATVVIGVALYAAWILGLWTLKVMGLLKPKG